MDVSALYTNIPNDEGILAVKNTLTNNKVSNILINVILTFLSMILTLNNFVLNGKHYLQTKGCAMGIKCHRIMQTYSWEYLNKTTSIIESKTNQCCTLDSLMTYSSYGL